MPTSAQSNTAASERYRRIAQLAAERDRQEAKLEQVERELRAVIYRLDDED